MASDLTAAGDELMRRFEDLDDPRKPSGRFQYPLQELLLTALCAISAGAEDWVDVSEWGEFKLEWLRRFTARSDVVDGVGEFDAEGAGHLGGWS